MKITYIRFLLLLLKKLRIIIFVMISRWVMNVDLSKYSSLTISPCIAIGMNSGDAFRYFFTPSLHKDL